MPDADLERDGVVRGLRAADGARLGAPRPHVAGDARRAVDRLPPARVARRARANGQALRSHLAGARGGRHRAGLGGGRVLDRALLADRPRRLARHPEVLRVAVSPGREAQNRGAVPVDVREQRARASGSRREGAADAARVHAQVRRVPDRGRRVPHPRAGAAARETWTARPSIPSRVSSTRADSRSASRSTAGGTSAFPRPHASSSSSRTP